MPTGSRRSSLLLPLLVAGAAPAAGRIGSIALDSSLYYAGVARWPDAPPFAGETHWSTRFPLILEGGRGRVGPALAQPGGFVMADAGVVPAGGLVTRCRSRGGAGADAAARLTLPRPRA